MKIPKISIDLRIALLYSFFGILWILISDRILAALFKGIGPLTQLQTFKGWVFVLISALLIYILVGNYRKARQSIEQKLRDSEANYRLLFEGNPLPMWVYDLETLKFLAVNNAAINKYGYRREEFMAMTLADIRPAHEVPALLSNINDNTGSYQFSGPWTHRRKHGQDIKVEIISHSLTYFDRSARLVMTNDITERLQSEALINSQIKQLVALHNIDNAINNSFELKTTLDVVLSEATNLLNMDAACVLLFNPAKNCLQYAAGYGFKTGSIEEIQLQMGEGLAGRAAKNQEVVHLHNISELNHQFTRPALLQEESFSCYHAAPLIAKGEVLGVLELFAHAHRNIDDEWTRFFTALTSQAAIALDNANLFNNLQNASTRLERAYDATIEGWSRALDLRDKETEGHSRRVTILAEQIASAMQLGSEEMTHVRRGALLHDIGKMGVPDSILHKPGPLTYQEWIIMRQHTTYAYEWLSGVEYLLPALDIPYCHHEKWDGSGYPRGLKGETIPISARIFAIVDVWDALTNDRPYRAAWSYQKTFQYIIEQSGKHFDPQIVQIFVDNKDQWLERES